MYRVPSTGTGYSGRVGIRYGRPPTHCPLTAHRGMACEKREGKLRISNTEYLPTVPEGKRIYTTRNLVYNRQAHTGIGQYLQYLLVPYEYTVPVAIRVDYGTGSRGLPPTHSVSPISVSLLTLSTVRYEEPILHVLRVYCIVASRRRRGSRKGRLGESAFSPTAPIACTQSPIPIESSQWTAELDVRCAGSRWAQPE